MFIIFSIIGIINIYLLVLKFIFEKSTIINSNHKIPLAERMRPKSLGDYIGQSHLVGIDKPLRKAIESGSLPSMLFWGPPGVGKTTLAQIISETLDRPFYTLSAISSGVKDIREIMSISKIVFSLSREPEAFGRVSLESLSIGSPVIAYSHGGVKEQLTKILPNGLIKVGSINDAIRLATKWIKEPPKIKQNNFFTLEKMLKKTLDLYNKMIKEKYQNLHDKKININ